MGWDGKLKAGKDKERKGMEGNRKEAKGKAWDGKFMEKKSTKARQRRKIMEKEGIVRERKGKSTDREINQGGGKRRSA